MRYSKGYKYQLKETTSFNTNFRPKENISTHFISVKQSGLLIINKGYAWDGPSGPTYDDELFIKASLAHDALYQLMRMSLLKTESWRRADKTLERIVLNYINAPSRKKGFKNRVFRSLWKVRLVYIMKALQLANGTASRPENIKKVYEIL